MLMKKVSMSAGFFIVALIILIVSSAPIKYDLKVGAVSNVTITAPFETVNEYETENKKKEVRQETLERKKIYYADDSVYQDGKKAIDKFFSKVYTERQNKAITSDAKVTTLKKQTYIKLTDDQYSLCLSADAAELKKLQGYCDEIYKTVMDERVEENQLNKAASRVKEEFEKKYISQNLKRLGSDIASNAIKQNWFYNEDATLRLAEAAENLVQNVMIKQGQKIVDNGQVVGPEQISMLKSLKLLKSNSKMDIPYYMALFLIILAVYAVALIYIYLFKPEILHNTKMYVMVNLIFILNLFIAAGMTNVHIYLIPTSLAALLISIFIDTKLAVLINALSTILISIMTKGQVGANTAFSFVYISLIVGTIGCMLIANSKSRSSTFGVGALMGIINMILIIIFEYIGYSKFDLNVLSYAVAGFFNCIISVTLAIGSMPMWEMLFDVLTPFKLMELANPNQPLIRRMLMEMPGTYHHSLIVGNLAEAAIQEIGGNALLARVGAYYHDIGKISRPYFFKENQFSDNPHEKLTPNLSSLVITSHVKDGIELANKYKLPHQITDFIRQHHGTTLVVFFYHKALQLDPETNEQNFRYAGPNPQTKEIAVVMLADSVEAAVRAMSEPTRGKVEGLIRKIIKDKLDSGQLEDSNLTFKDLNIIAKTFVRVLSGVFHERIEYPELSKDKKQEVKSIESKELTKQYDEPDIIDIIKEEKQEINRDEVKLDVKEEEQEIKLGEIKKENFDGNNSNP